MSESKPLSFDFELGDAVETKPLLQAHEIHAVQDNVRKRDRYPLEETRTRNIIMLGRSGSGKTTAIGVLKDPCALPRPQSLFSDTVGARYQSFALDHKDKNIKYSINIIDTPGVQEVKPIGQEARSDSAILDTIKYCLKNEITRVHTLLIFASFGGRISPADKEAFKIYLDMFYDKEVSIAFCITKAEGTTDEWRKNVIADLSQDDFFSEVLQKENIKVVFSGCVDNLRIKESPTPKDLFMRYNDIYVKRKELIEFVFASKDEGVMLMSLPVVSGTKLLIEETFTKIEEFLVQFENTTDFRTGSFNLEIGNFSRLVDTLFENEGMFTDPNMYERFAKMKARMKAILNKMPNEKEDEIMRSRFIGKIVM